MVIILIGTKKVSPWVLNRSVVIGLYGSEWAYHFCYKVCIN